MAVELTLFVEFLCMIPSIVKFTTTCSFSSRDLEHFWLQQAFAHMCHTHMHAYIEAEAGKMAQRLRTMAALAEDRFYS